MLLFILVQGFCPLKIKITQFPNGVRLNILTSLQKLGFQMDYETRIYTLTPETNKTNKSLSTNQLETLHTTTSDHCYRFRAANNRRSLDTGRPKLCLTKSNLSSDIMSREFFYHNSFYGTEE